MSTQSEIETFRPAEPFQYELFWYFINERHAIYLRRQAGESKPWTDDVIMQRYKFTNAFRQLDTGTVWLTEHWLSQKWRTEALTHSSMALDMKLLLFNICLYRHINWWETADWLGYTTSWSAHMFESRMGNRLAQGFHVWTGAHIIRSRDGLSKAQSVAITLDELWGLKEELFMIARGTKSLEAVFDRLLQVPFIGEFLAYEFVSDMRWTPILSDATDIMTWANAGPGAQRGLKRLWPDIKRSEYLAAMRFLLAESARETEEWVPDLEMREIEHSLCEFDKYTRVYQGEGKPRSVYPGDH